MLTLFSIISIIGSLSLLFRNAKRDYAFMPWTIYSGMVDLIHQHNIPNAATYLVCTSSCCKSDLLHPLQREELLSPLHQHIDLGQFGTRIKQSTHGWPDTTHLCDAT